MNRMDGRTMTPQEQKKAAKAFVKRWKEAKGCKLSAFRHPDSRCSRA